jgi:membrane protein YqaA with SNARE-associated domain
MWLLLLNVVFLHSDSFKCVLSESVGDGEETRKAGLARLATGYELLAVMGGSFISNLMPFAGPSNLLIALLAAMSVDADPITIGLLVALGSASAKFIHYIITFFIGRFVNKKWKEKISEKGTRLRHWAPLALFVVAASPLPDEPVVVPLGLIKYSPARFFIVYFLGKLSITIVGAYLGRAGQQSLGGWVNQEVMMAISIVLTIVATIILLKVDLGKIVERILKRKVGLT